MSHSLLFLTEGDWRALRSKSTHVHHERDEVIVHEGAPTPGVMLIESGIARVEQRRGGFAITLGRMTEGEVFGEMSLLEDTVASASVIADEPTSVELFGRSEIEALLQSDPGFASRFHRSIAVHLSRRFRQRSSQLSPLATLTGSAGARPRATRLGQITSRQLPPAVVAAVGAFDGAMAQAERGAASGARSPEGARRVAEACDRLLESLARSLTPEVLFEAASADLGSFRDPGDLASGIGGYVFRQTFSWFMSATTIARAYMRPRGFAEDHETLSLIVGDEPDGDGEAGPLLDRWFLSRPLCRFRRDDRPWASALLRRALSEAGGANEGGRASEGVVSAAALASGTGSEAIEVLAEPSAGRLRLTCIDLDPEALSVGAERADELGVARRVAFMNGNAVPAPGEPVASLGRHRFVYALGLLEYLSDAEAAQLLEGAWGMLVPGGTLALSTLGAANPDRLFMEHILDWHVAQRSRGQIEALFAASRFAPPSIEPDPSGAGFRIVARR